MQAERKKSVCRAAKVAGFLLLTVAVCVALYFGARPKDIPRSLNAVFTYRHKVFYERDNSIDVAFIGHSGVYSAVSPMELYDAYGIAGYDCAQPLMAVGNVCVLTRPIQRTESPRSGTGSRPFLLRQGRFGVQKPHETRGLDRVSVLRVPLVLARRAQKKQARTVQGL